MQVFDSQYMPHQREALDAIEAEYAQGKKVISFQLCTGSGKTRVIIRLPSLLGLKRNVYVFPTLALIDQFKTDYLDKYKFFSYKEVSTNGISEQDLLAELQKPEFCLLTTYVSLPMILEYAEQVDGLIFDEAHHVDGPKCEQSISLHSHKIRLQLRASATLNEGETPCYTYSFAQAVRDGRCRDYGIYCFIRKAGAETQLLDYLFDHHQTTGNGRVMAFTRWSSAERDDSQSVMKFYSMYADAVKARGGWIQTITADTKNREEILKDFDSQPDDKLSILVSCRTISEGVDTRNANVAFFVDTDSNNVSIIQRIGRATRPYRDAAGKILPEQRSGSVLVGMYISPEKYEAKSKEEVDRVLKQEMSADGDFGPIFRILAALRQTDEEMYERCVRYPHFDRLAREAEKKGYDLVEGGVEDLYGDYEDLDQLAEDNGVCVVEHEGKIELEHGEGKEEVHVLRDGDSVHFMADKKQKYPEVVEKKRKRKPALTLDVDSSVRMLFGIEGNLDEEMVAKITVEVENDGKSAEERAVEKAKELVKWVKENGGKMPSMYSKDSLEKRLGNWFGKMKSIKRGNRMVLYPSVERIFEKEFGDDWWKEIDLEARAVEKAKELVKWTRENGIPSSKGTTKEDKKLANWFGKMKSIKRGGDTNRMVLYPSVERIFEKEFGDDWWKEVDREDQAIKRAREFIEWVKENGRPPYSKAKSQVEKALGIWFSNMKRAKKDTGGSILYSSVERILEKEFGENWWKEVDREAQAIEQAMDLLKWVRQTGKIPSITSKIQEEKKLATWLCERKSAKKGQTTTILYPSVERILEELGEDWWKEVDREAQAIETAKDLVKWIKENGKTPSTTSKVLEEKRLASWFSSTKNKKKGGGKIYPSVERILEELGEDWWWGMEEKALRRAEEFVKWVLHNGKTPSNGSKIPEEKKLATWFNGMKKSRKGYNTTQVLYPNVERILEELLGKDWYLLRAFSIPKQSSSSHSSTCSVQPDGSGCDCHYSVLGKHREFQLEEDDDSPPAKSLVYKPTSPKSAQAASQPSFSPPRSLPTISQLHKEYKSLKSSNLHQRFQQHPEEWREYHRLSEQNESGFGEEIPWKRVVRYIESTYTTKKSRIIVDLGCGMARVAKELASKPHLSFINIDHVACDQTVEAGDISRTRLEDGEADLAILCLAMWGSNCEEYLVEAHRILDTQGRLIVIEPSKRWDNGDRLREMLTRNGFMVVKEEVSAGDGLFYKFCMFVVSKR